jgi:hypothetical protein
MHFSFYSHIIDITKFSTFPFGHFLSAKSKTFSSKRNLYFDLSRLLLLSLFRHKRKTYTYSLFILAISITIWHIECNSGVRKIENTHVFNKRTIKWHKETYVCVNFSPGLTSKKLLHACQSLRRHKFVAFVAFIVNL